jgi:hypothetical protein
VSGERRGGKSGGADAGEGEVGGELDEVAGVVAAEDGFVGGERAGHALDFAEGEGAGTGYELVDAAGQGEGPAGVEEAAGDDDLERGGGGFVGGAGAQLVVPVRAELGAPESGGTAAGVVRAGGERRELADAQAGTALVEIEFHAINRTDGNWTKVRT